MSGYDCTEQWAGPFQFGREAPKVGPVRIPWFDSRASPSRMVHLIVENRGLDSARFSLEERHQKLAPSGSLGLILVRARPAWFT